MYGPYTARIVGKEKVIDYIGNKANKKIANIHQSQFTEDILEDRVGELTKNKAYHHLHKIDNAIFLATIQYFNKLGAEWCNLPLTTLMISSPGEIYAGERLNYTTDTAPIDLSWFNAERKIFLSESSQFYLELRLLIDKVDRVFSIYNSFRKEKADFSHLSEFQHIEFEGHVTFDENMKIATELLEYITNYVVENNSQNLTYFLNEAEIEFLHHAFHSKNVEIISFKEALDLLFEATHNPIYRKFSIEHFGVWEEVKITEILRKHVWLTEFPLLQVSFYHDHADGGEIGSRAAKNADLILYGYREVIGSGLRISNPEILAEKAKVFNLPLEDYGAYLKVRSLPSYKQSAGFGLGWQRYVHWLLKLPYIWEATHVPRGHFLPKP